LVITGASSGLGLDLAIKFAAPGVSIGMTGRNSQRLEAAAQACRERGASVTTAAIDAGDAQAMGAWLTAFDQEEPVDLLVANAGILGGPADERSLDGLELATRIIRTNLLGVVNAVETLAPAMIARGAGQIAIISSTSALRGLPYMPAYGASKAGARLYGEGLRAQLAPLGVKVSVVVPGFFKSAMTDQVHGSKPMMISAQAAAERIWRGLLSAQPRIVLPRRAGLLMRLLDLMPAAWGDALLRQDRPSIDPPS
jgi:short-subunit dehydrogenase